MLINGVVRAEIRFNLCEGNIDKALKIMLKLKMSLDPEETIENILVLNNDLAWAYRKKNNIEMVKHYLKCNEEIFLDKKIINERQPLYYTWLWMNTEAYEDSITKEAYCSNFIKIFRYYKSQNNDRFSIGAIKNITVKIGRDEDIVNFIINTISERGLDQLCIDLIEDLKEENEKVYKQIKKIIMSHHYGEDII